MLDSGGLRARERMAADEALVAARVDHDALRRADIGDDAVRSRRRERRAHGVFERADGRCDERNLRVADGARDVGRVAVDHAELERLRAHARVGVIAAYGGLRPLPSGEADRASDQPDAEQRDPHLCQRAAVRAEAALRSRTDSARPSSTATVVSQSMQPSVIDWP